MFIEHNKPTKLRTMLNNTLYCDFNSVAIIAPKISFTWIYGTDICYLIETEILGISLKPCMMDNLEGDSKAALILTLHHL